MMLPLRTVLLGRTIFTLANVMSSTVKSLIDLPVDSLKEAAVTLHTRMLSGGLSSETMKKDYTKLVATLAAIEQKEVKGKVRKR